MSSSVTGINSLATLFLAPNSQVTHHERRISQIEQLNQMPLYPTEKIIWDENIVPTEYYSGEGVCEWRLLTMSARPNVYENIEGGFNVVIFTLVQPWSDCLWQSSNLWKGAHSNP